MIIAARSLLCVYLRSIGESTQLLRHSKEGGVGKEVTPIVLNAPKNSSLTEGIFLFF